MLAHDTVMSTDHLRITNVSTYLHGILDEAVNPRVLARPVDHAQGRLPQLYIQTKNRMLFHYHTQKRLIFQNQSQPRGSYPNA